MMMKTGSRLRLKTLLTEPDPKMTAFSAIEMLIVVIIISFLLLALLFFHNLSKNNSIKALIAQIAGYDRAIKQFHIKYSALPGDVDSTIAFGLSDFNSDGNNNSLIEDSNGDIWQASGEITNFWLHLSNSQFINQKFDGAIGKNAKIGFSFPISKINMESGITVFNYNGKNYYQIGVAGADNNKIIMSDNSLRAAESFNIDLKIDDGLPNNGRVIVVGGNIVNGIYEDTNCVLGKEYNIKITEPSCQIRIEIGTMIELN